MASELALNLAAALGLVMGPGCAESDAWVRYERTEAEGSFDVVAAECASRGGAIARVRDEAEISRAIEACAVHGPGVRSPPCWTATPIDVDGPAALVLVILPAQPLLAAWDPDGPLSIYGLCEFD